MIGCFSETYHFLRGFWLARLLRRRERSRYEGIYHVFSGLLVTLGYYLLSSSTWRLNDINLHRR